MTHHLRHQSPRTTRGRLRQVLLALGLSTAFIASTAVPAAASGLVQKEDILEQGGGSVLAVDGARLVRQPNGMSVSMKIPAPAPGTYVYPDGTSPGSPEVFTMWVFVFNHPEHCSDPCGSDDANNPDVEFGVYNTAGHVNAGASLTLSGHISVGAEAGGPPGVTPHPLSNPDGAEVHYAITSHGGFDPANLPGEFRRPTGSPVCGCWWSATFK